jgi:hypothetical protein
MQVSDLHHTRTMTNFLETTFLTLAGSQTYRRCSHRSHEASKKIARPKIRLAQIFFFTVVSSFSP